MGPVILLWACAGADGPAGETSGRPDTATDSAPDTGSETDTAPDSDPDTKTDTNTDPDTGPPPPLEICVNELMPANQSVIRLEDGTTPDWIELHNPGTTAVSLDGWALTDDPAEPARSPLDGLVLGPGAFLLLYADGAAKADHLAFALAAEGGEVVLRRGDGAWASLQYGAVADDFAVARSTDCCTGEGCLVHDFRGTPGATNEAVVLESVELLGRASTWAWWDTGTVPALDWAQPGYDDSAWPRGPGPLGYGDAQTTVVSYGPDAANKHVTTWFRAEVEVTGAAQLAEAWVELQRDDGALVYLNGTELLRSNLPSGEITASTLASSAVGDAAETAYSRTPFDVALLLEGTNVLAVEVHQATVDSSDLSFDLALGGERAIE